MGLERDRPDDTESGEASHRQEKAKSLLRDAEKELAKLTWIAGSSDWRWSLEEVASWLAQEESDRRYYKAVGKRYIMWSLHSDQDPDDKSLAPCTPDASPQAGIFRKCKRIRRTEDGIKHEEALTIKLILKEYGDDVRMVFGLQSPADSEHHLKQDIGLVNGGGAVLQGHQSLGYVYYPAPSTK